MKSLVASSGLFLLLLLFCLRVDACRFTPLEWQQTVEKTQYSHLRGQRKHTTWSRDRDRDFIDDRIARYFKPGQTVDIVVALNKCVPPATIVERFSAYGRIAYASRLITYVMLDEVRFDELPRLAAMEDVAMIEWANRGRPAIDVSTRAVQVRKSATPPLGYSNNTVEELTTLTGNGVAIAILDSGVDDQGTTNVPPGHQAFAVNRFVGGFNALGYEDANVNSVDDDCEVASPAPNCDDWSGSNPGASTEHGTVVAGTALANAVAGKTCRTPNDGSTGNCAGIAPAAKLVDIQVCDDNCIQADVGEGLDWLAVNAQAMGTRVANLSLAFCDVDISTLPKDPDDGTSALSQQVNYVVALGTVVTVAHGNARTKGCASLGPGSRFSVSPGASSLAITVAANDDHGTIRRGDDTVWAFEGDGYLIGPREGFDPTTPEPYGLKPDLAAPGYLVKSALRGSANGYIEKSGTSMAAPHVAGAAALIIEARPNIDPGGVKDLLTSKADRARNVNPYAPLAGNSQFAQWDTAFGWGLLNVYDAISTASASDVGFPNCVGPGWAAGKPCAVTPPRPSWGNNLDITTRDPPVAKQENEIIATVRNTGGAVATVNVNFGVYRFAAGNNQFYHVGTQRVTLQPNETKEIHQLWTPSDDNHQCVQVTIDFGLDTNYANNVTQLNLQVLPQASPAIYELQVENPFMRPASLELEAKSDRANWVCRVDRSSFEIDPFKDCPKKVRVTFEAPAGAAPGEYANCEIAVTAKPQRGRSVLIGGVTVQTFVPKPCRGIGTIVDSRGRPIGDARVRIGPAPPAGSIASEEAARRAARVAAGTEAGEVPTDEFGVFSTTVLPHVPQLIEVSHGDLRAKLVARFQCGVDRREFVLTREGLSLAK